MRGTRPASAPVRGSPAHISPDSPAAGSEPRLVAVIDIRRGVVQRPAAIYEQPPVPLEPEMIAADSHDVVGLGAVENVIEGEQTRAVHRGRPAAPGRQVEGKGPHAARDGG